MDDISEVFMISPLFMALDSACMTHSRLPDYVRLATQGNFADARALAKQARKRFTDALSRSLMDQAAADMSILMSDYEQAESLYASSVSDLSGSPFLSAVSCRATGIQALFQNRFDVAAHCFRRNTEEMVAMEYRLEGYATLALIYREVGLDKDAQENFVKLSRLAKQSSHPVWRELSNLLALDLAAYRTIYASSAMNDHIFRHKNGVVEEVADEALVSDQLEDLEMAQEFVSLLRARKQHLSNMIHLVNGEKVEWNELENFSQGSFAKNSRLYLKYACIEIGLAALAGGHSDIVQKLMLNFQWLGSHVDRSANRAVRIDRNELLYFVSKIETKHTSIDESQSLYQHYLESAFKAIHQFTNKLQQIVSVGLVKTSAQEIHLDESTTPRQISEPIPLRCQRAYDYIKENSWRSDVSVREVASSIGVSERWLQMQFKRHYGCSPKTVIRIHT
jgi:hypothetical protein